MKLEFSTMQQGTQIMIANDNDLATLVAEKLYQKVKEDLINSGTSLISEVKKLLSIQYKCSKVSIF